MQRKKNRIVKKDPGVNKPLNEKRRGDNHKKNCDIAVCGRLENESVTIRDQRRNMAVSSLLL